MRVGINGFGRLGLRAVWGRQGLDIVRVNETAADAAGSARAITRIFPKLEGKLNGHAVRVRLLNASLN